MVNVSYGEHSRQIELAGRTVADVREMFKSEFDLSDRAQANLNGQSLKKKLEAETELCNEDELYFEEKSRRPLVLLGAFLLALAVTGGIFAYTATTDTATLLLSDYGDFVDVAENATLPTWDVWGNYRGAVSTGEIFVVTPDAGGPWTGDISVLVTIANAEDLVECYRVLVMEIEVHDSADNNIGTTEYLSLGRGEVDIDVDYDADTPYTVEITGGYYITHRGGWTSGSEDPIIMCQVLQRSAP